MTIKEQIIQELEEMPEPMLEKILEYLHKLQAEDKQLEEKAWQAYLQSETERKEVYRRLANS